MTFNEQLDDPFYRLQNV